MLSETKNVAAAASSSGMSREGAYRLRARRDGALFGALWDRIVQPEAGRIPDGHTGPLTDGRLMRLLGMHFRRERGDFLAIGATAAERRQPDRTRPS